MMDTSLNIPGIELDEHISSHADIHVFRGRLGEDAEHKIIKIAELTSGSAENVVKLEHEYQIIRELEIQGVPHCYGLLYFDKFATLVLQDMGGKTLARELEKGGSLAPVAGIRLGLKLLEIIGAIHDKKIIHKDINPSNIVFSTDVTECALIDFCKAIPFSREQNHFRPLPRIEGTLAYMAPEQTGRMNREMDYRADFYALGVTLYQALTGRLPFESDDPLTLLHAHIAMSPPPAHERNPQLPGYVSDMLGKLLAKSAGDRYQTVEGIRTDLRTCLDKITSGETDRFELGVADETGVFRIPQKLYGREAEKELVLESFRAIESGGSGVLFVGGLSGIGKTALVRETHPEISRCGGLYCEGKFDQLGRNTPYSALVQACSRLLEQTLLSGGDQKELWQGKLTDALGHNAQVMVDVLPVLKPFVSCEPIEVLGPLETQNRFKYVFTRFLKIFCKAEHPVVLFLDDLQWMDLGTLRLLDHLISGKELDYFLLVGCFRSNELHETHPLRDIMKSWEEQDTAYARLDLAPLGNRAVTDMLCDVFAHLGCDREHFTDLLLNRTGGNPFFLRQFLGTLYREERVRFDRDTNEWIVNLEALEQAADNGIVDFMVHQLEKLPERTRRVLHGGACIGNEFDVPLLSMSLDLPPEQTHDHLFPAVESGLLVPDLSSLMSLGIQSEEPERIRAIYRSYRFQHDRVQQAALLLDMVDKRVIHRRIGVKFLSEFSEEQKPEHLFSLVGHLNESGWGEESEENGDKLFLLNLRAANSAVKATSYEAAYTYLQQGERLLPEKEWNTSREKGFSLCRAMAEVRYLLGFHEDAAQWMDKAISLGSNNMEKAGIYNLKLIQQGLIGKYWESLETAFAALELLGVSIDYRNSAEAIGTVFTELSTLVNEENIGEVYDKPVIDNDEIAFALKIISEIMSVSYAVDKRIFVLINLTSVLLSLKHGMCADAAGSFSCTGLLHIAMFDKPELGIAYGELGKKLGDRFDELSPRSKAYDFYCNFVVPWAHPLSETEPLNREAFGLALDTGDLPFAGFIANHRAYNSYYMGLPLQQVLDDSRRYLIFCDRISHHYAFDCVQGVVWAIEYLQNEGGKTTPLPLGREEFLSMARAPESPFPVSRYLILLMQIHILEGNGEAAWKLAQETANLQEHVTGTISSAEYRYYRILAGLMFCRNQPQRERQKLLTALRQESVFFTDWAARNPHTFSHKDHLLQAEIASLDGDIEKAMDNFDAAIDSARGTHFAHEEALGCERAIQFWERCGKKRMVPAYAREAYIAHRKWGCRLRASALAKQYPELIQPSRQTDTSLIDGLSGSTTQKEFALDELLRSVAVISEASTLDQLNRNALQLLMEGGGADIGAFFIRDESRLQLTAYAFVDKQKIKVERPDPAPLEEACSHYTIPTLLLDAADTEREAVIVNSYEDLGALWPERKDLILSDFREKYPKSMICLPVLKQGKITALLYLANTATEQAFTRDRLQLMQALSGQLSVSLENAMLYENLENIVSKRTKALKSANSKLKRLSNMDGLTQLYNRRYFDQALEMEIDRAHRSDTPLSLLMCDIDYFKKFNDYYGHVAGDNCIRSVAEILLASCGRTTDLAARYGGEEFAVILPNTAVSGALAVAERIIGELSARNIAHIGSKSKGRVTLSIGITSLVPDHGCTASQLVNYADTALYESKKNGRDQVTVKQL